VLFVVKKTEFEHAISIARDDHVKASQGRTGPFIRLEANDNYVEVEGLEAASRIPATVYEQGALFLKITVFRRLLRTIRGEKFLTIQATADELIVDKAHLPLEANDMLLYADPSRAPRMHPDQGPLVCLQPASRVDRVASTRPQKPKPVPKFRQLLLWDEYSDAAPS
jgi:hypothetical protein